MMHKFYVYTRLRKKMPPRQRRGDAQRRDSPQGGQPEPDLSRLLHVPDEYHRIREMAKGVKFNFNLLSN